MFYSDAERYGKDFAAAEKERREQKSQLRKGLID